MSPVWNHCSSGGLLSEEEQQRATSICICLLKFLHQWGGAAKPAGQEVEMTQSTPGSHAQAVLQLLARLTKRHSLALQVLHLRHERDVQQRMKCFSRQLT